MLAVLKRSQEQIKEFDITDWLFFQRSDSDASGCALP